MRVVHLFVGLVFLWALLVSERPLNNISIRERIFRLETLPSAEEMGVFWMEFLFHWSSWILSVLFINLTITMELDLMNHCACGIWTLELRFSLAFSPVDMQNQDSHFFHQPRSSSGAINVPVAIIPIQWLLFTCH